MTTPSPKPRRKSSRLLVPGTELPIAEFLEALSSPSVDLTSAMQAFPGMGPEQAREALRLAAQRLRPKKKTSKDEDSLGASEPAATVSQDRAPQKYSQPRPHFGTWAGDSRSGRYIDFGIQTPANMAKMGLVRVHIDGCCKGNPGPSGIGVVLLDSATGATLGLGCAYLGEMTNTAAEYHGLIAAMRQA